MGKGRSKNKPGGGGNFAMLPHYLLKSAAWRDLDTNARALYVEILFRFNGTNNGSIGLGTREAGKALHVSKDTAIRAFDALVDHGLIVLATASTFNQKRLSREWLLTDHPDDRNGQGARKDFMKWGTEKQKIGASQGQIGASQGLCGNGVSRNEPDRRTTGTVKPPEQSLQAHHRDTYISNHGQNVGVGMAEVATATTGNRFNCMGVATIRFSGPAPPVYRATGTGVICAFEPRMCWRIKVSALAPSACSRAVTIISCSS